MKNIWMLSLIVSMGCNTSINNESVGQIKKIKKATPMLCSDYTEVDVSLGVMRNGVGSMSHEDLVLAIDNAEKETIEQLQKAAEDGSIVKFNYDVKRFAICWPDARLQPKLVIEAVPVK